MRGQSQKGLGLGAAAVAACFLLCVPARASDRGVLDDLFAHWASSLGGLGGTQFLRAYETDETEEIEGAPGPKTTLHVLRTAGGHFRFEVTRPGMAPSVQAWDGRVGWQTLADGSSGFLINPASDIWMIQNDLLFAYKALRPPIRFKALDPARLNGHDCMVASVTDLNNNEGTCYFDRASRLLVRIERRLSPTDPATVSEDYDDYRDVEGFHVPFLMRMKIGNVVSVLRRSRVVINPPVADNAFVMSTAQYQEALALRDIVRRRDTAMGSAAAFSRIETRVTHLSVEVSTSGTTSEETVYQKHPNAILVEVQTPGMGKEARGYDGATGWFSSELQGYRPLRPAELAQLQSEGSVHMVGTLETALPLRRRVGERLVGDRAAVAIALASLQGPAGTFYFDKENDRLLRIAAPVSGDRENSTEATTDFSDFRRVDGVEIPFVVVQSNPLLRTVSTVRSIENNPPIADAIFKPSPED